MLISLVVGPILIRRLKSFQFGQVIRPEGPASHRPKAGTPTMGGLLILASAIVPTLLWADLASAYVWIAVLSTVAFGADVDGLDHVDRAIDAQVDIAGKGANLFARQGWHGERNQHHQ